jgi:choline dehydrogenase-like flavoprotein
MLMLNGIGPTKELERLNIPVVKDLPGVGKHLRDHVLSFLCVEIDSKHNNRYGFETSESQMAEAVANWEKDKTGNLALYNSGLWGGFLKLPGLEDLPEYKALAPNTQRFLSQDKTPTYEIIGNCLLFPPGTQLPEGSSYLTSVAFLMNAQSEGAVTLRSADPEDKPEIELNFLQHPYDKRIFREAIRQTWTKVYENPEIKPLIKSRLFAPKSLSDEDVDAFMKDATSTVWHANGTAMMGKPENPQACVDTSFRVYGTQGLRVADLSVCPLTTK